MAETKKSYNPFRMWGAWVGAGLMFLNALRQPINPVVRNIFFANYVFLVLIATTFGFLIGWGIHSFFRKIRN